MAGVVDEKRQVWMGAADLFDFLRPDVSVPGAEVHHDRTARHLRSVCRDLPTVIAHSRGRTKPGGCEPGETAAITIPNNSPFKFGPLGAAGFVGGGTVLRR